MPKRSRCATLAIGDAVEVYWPEDKCYYCGRLDDFNKSTQEFCVLYDNGHVEYLNFDGEEWRFPDSSSKKYKIPCATANSRRKKAARNSTETEILLETAHELVLKVVRKSIRLHEQSNSSISPWLAIRTAEDLLCVGLTKPSIFVKTEPVKQFSYQDTPVINEVREILLQASKIMSPFVLRKREYEDDVARVISVGVSLVIAARSILEN